MIAAAYTPTSEQEAIVGRSGNAFITACPGAGKTRTMVERAKRLLQSPDDRRGIAFLSFTNAAVEELEARLRDYGVLLAPLFPSFIGTFDGFLWQFFIAPFGVPGCQGKPRLIPDKSLWEVKPFDGAQGLPLSCFDRQTGRIIPAAAALKGFDVTARKPTAYETSASRILAGAKSEGRLDFDDVRACVADRLADAAFSARLGAALAGRFQEVVVDEAQDCNPADLAVIDWLRRSGVAVNIICDPHQSIYEFRGGVADELRQFSETFAAPDRLTMSGNFRSTPAICSAIVMLRPPADRVAADQPLGPNKADNGPVHILSYSGKGVPSTIGSTYRGLVETLGAPLIHCPVVAATRATAFNAIGQPPPKQSGHMTLLLADAVTGFHFSFALGDRRDALVNLHRIVATIQGLLDGSPGYHSYVNQPGLDRGEWRPAIIEIAQALRFDPSETPDQWLARARSQLASTLVGTSSINQRLRTPTDWGGALTVAPADAPPARTIHSVKGMEFPAVCVVMTTATSNGILTYLEGSGATDQEEAARKLYVAASRAQRLLAVAIPKSQATRMEALLAGGGCQTEVHHI